jgi:peptidoglycan/LPS O-acetylase OafA/YrhL
MKDIELTGTGKAAYAGLCVACCGFPMLVALGIVSIGVAFALGVSLAAAIGVAFLAYLVVRHKTGHVPAMFARMLGVIGAAMAVYGLWFVDSSTTTVSVMSLAIGSIAAAALLVLADVDLESEPLVSPESDATADDAHISI